MSRPLRQTLPFVHQTWTFGLHQKNVRNAMDHLALISRLTGSSSMSVSYCDSCMLDTPTDESVGFLSNACARNRYVGAQRVCPTQNVQGSVVIGIRRVAAIATHELRLIHPVCLLGMPTDIAALAGISGVNRLHSFPGAFCLESEYLKELRPSYVMD